MACNIGPLFITPTHPNMFFIISSKLGPAISGISCRISL
jgi:hypothetical protein